MDAEQIGTVLEFLTDKLSALEADGTDGLRAGTHDTNVLLREWRRELNARLLALDAQDWESEVRP